MSESGLTGFSDLQDMSSPHTEIAQIGEASMKTLGNSVRIYLCSARCREPCRKDKKKRRYFLLTNRRTFGNRGTSSLFFYRYLYTFCCGCPESTHHGFSVLITKIRSLRIVQRQWWKDIAPIFWAERFNGDCQNSAGVYFSVHKEVLFSDRDTMLFCQIFIPGTMRMKWRIRTLDDPNGCGPVFQR